MPQHYNKCRTRYIGLRLWARHINEVGILFKTSKGLRLCGSSSCYITDDVRCFEESCWTSWHNWKVLGCWLYFCCFFLLKSRRDSLSLVVHKLGCDLTTKQMNMVQSVGTAMSPLCENFGKDLIASFVANKSPFDRYLTICATLCKALHLCFVAKINCKKCIPRSTSSISSTKTIHTNQFGPSKDKTTP